MAQNSLLDLQEMKPTPRNQLLGLLADALTAGRNFADRAKVPAAVPVLGGQGLGSLLLGKAPEELTEISYGNMPLRINPLAGRTASFVPEIKPGRKEQLADLVMAAQAVPGGNRAALAALGAVDTGVGKAMFIGPTAKTWDKAAAATAQKMEKAGADPRAIWSETGTFKGPDGKWRQEISDHNIRPLARTWGEGKDLEAGSSTVTKRQRALAHPELSAAYPDTKSIIVSMKPGQSGNASFSSGGVFGDEIALQVSPRYGHKANPSTMIHELQHAIQQREGFARGGSPDAMWPEFESELARLPVVKAQVDQARNQASSQAASAIANDPALVRAAQSYSANLGEFQASAPIQAQVQDYILSQTPGYARSYKELSDLQRSSRIDPTERYRRLAGEAEARATQSRMNMTPAERRATFPFDSYDVPVNELIVRGLLGP